MILKSLTLLVILRYGLSFVCNTKYSVKDVCYEEYGSVIDVINNVTSFAACAALCCQDQGCASVIFDGSKHLCTTNSGISSYFATGCGLKYAKFVQSNCKSLKSIGKACKTNTECIEDIYSCVEGVCMCAAGYSFNSANETCLTTCDHYGDSFTAFHGYVIAAHNNLKLTDMDETSCKAACVTTTDFMCRSIEITTFGVCFLSTETALTQKDDYTEYPGYSYYQRNCKLR